MIPGSGTQLNWPGAAARALLTELKTLLKLGFPSRDYFPGVHPSQRTSHFAATCAARATVAARTASIAAASSSPSRPAPGAHVTTHATSKCTVAFPINSCVTLAASGPRGNAEDVPKLPLSYLSSPYTTSRRLCSTAGKAAVRWAASGSSLRGSFSHNASTTPTIYCTCGGAAPPNPYGHA